MYYYKPYYTAYNNRTFWVVRNDDRYRWREFFTTEKDAQDRVKELNG